MDPEQLPATPPETPATPPETPAAEVPKEAAQPDRPDKIAEMATIEWAPQDAEAAPANEECRRGLPAIFIHLRDAAEARKLKGDELVKVYVKAVSKTGKDMQLLLAEGPVGAVMKGILSRIIPSNAAIQNLQGYVHGMTGVTTLKGLVVTAVFDDAKAAGFGMLSTSIDVTEEDIKVLAMAAANQAELFKDNVRQQGIVFPDDGGIVTPAGFTPKLST